MNEPNTWSTQYTWTGIIDEAAAWNRALSVSEVLEIYNAQKGTYVAYETPAGTTEIVAGLDTGPNNGIARVIVDGGTAREIVTEIDTYNATQENDQRFLVATGLDSDVHTVKIESTGVKNLSSSGTIVAPKFIEKNTNSSVATSDLEVNGRYIDDVIIQDYQALPNAVYFPDKGNISESKHEGTMEMWVETDWAGNDNAYHILFDTRDNANQNGMTVYKSINNKIYLQYNDGATSANIISADLDAVNWAANTPHHLIAKWWKVGDSKMGFALYLNGLKIAENKSFLIVPTEHNTLYIGQLSSDQISETYDFDGQIYDLAIYSKAFDDGGVSVGTMAGTGSTVFNAYKSIASKTEQIKAVTASGSSINAAD